MIKQTAFFSQPFFGAALRLLAGGMLCLALLGGPVGVGQAVGQNASPGMSVRLGAHEDYTRIVFDFPRLTAYRLDRLANGDAQLVFDTTLAPTAIPRPAGAIRAITPERRDDNTLAVTLSLAEKKSEVRHYRLTRRIVVDVRMPAPAKTTAPPATARKPQTSPAPSPPAPVQANPTPQALPQAADVVTPETTVIIDHPAAEDNAAEEAAPTAPTTITLSTVEPTRLAVFQRDGTLWVVLGSRAGSATQPRIQGPDSGFLGQGRPVSFEGGRAYRYSLPQARDVSVTRRNLIWEITIGQNLRQPAAAGNLMTRHDETTGRARLIANLRDPGAVLAIDDPVVGDRLLVVPVSDPQFRIENRYRYANAEILPAQAGLAVRPVTENLRVTRLGAFVTISAPEGIAASPGAASAASLIDTAATRNTEESRRLFDFPNWLQGGIIRLNENRRFIEAEIAAATTPEERKEGLLRLALLYFANNFGQETLGVLRILEREDQDMTKNPNILALRGAAAAMAGHYDAALADLSAPAIQNHPEVNLWIGYAAAATEQWRRANSAFPRNSALLADYPPDIAIPMTIYMAESALRLGNTDTAENLLDTLTALPINEQPRYGAAVAYLRGEVARQEGRPDEAIRHWTSVSDGLDRLYHAKATLALTQLRLQEKEITPQEAADRIDSLRFSWRGDGLEVQILSTLGKLKILSGRPLQGLQDLKSAAALAARIGDDPTPLRQDMAEAVTNLFTGADRQKINPLEAVAIYNDFSDLLPGGEQGADAMMNFADYLIGMDLLDRAATVIRQAYGQTVTPSKKAEIGARLGTIHLLDGKPALALEIIDASAPPQRDALSPALNTRRALLRARALSQLNRTNESIAVLSNLDTPEARRLTADVLWRARRWKEAADAIESLLPATPPPKPDDDTARLIMNAAVGYKLANDSAGLARMRSLYAAGMAATPLGPTFNIVTRDGGASGLSDRETILDIAGEVDMFKSLLDSYKAAQQPATGSGE